MSEKTSAAAKKAYLDAIAKEERGDGCFGNPGPTLKVIGNIVFIVGVILVVLWMIVLLVSGDNTPQSYALAATILVGGSLASYATGALLTAVGEIAKCAREMNRKIK